MFPRQVRSSAHARIVLHPTRSSAYCCTPIAVDPRGSTAKKCVQTQAEKTAIVQHRRVFPHFDQGLQVINHICCSKPGSCACEPESWSTSQRRQSSSRIIGSSLTLIELCKPSTTSSAQSPGLELSSSCRDHIFTPRRELPTTPASMAAEVCMRIRVLEYKPEKQL